MKRISSHSFSYSIFLPRKTHNCTDDVTRCDVSMASGIPTTTQMQSQYMYKNVTVKRKKNSFRLFLQANSHSPGQSNPDVSLTMPPN